MAMDEKKDEPRRKDESVKNRKMRSQTDVNDDESVISN